MIPFDSAVNPKSDEKCGLICGDGNVPLRAVHIQAKIIDMVAQVSMFQEYVNSRPTEIEAKYVFPVPDNGAVCGFEVTHKICQIQTLKYGYFAKVFIRDKHIIAKVKEKETAQKEYKEAIAQGHGAYLLEEEEPNIFTMHVGNIPPNTNVIIKVNLSFFSRIFLN